MSDENELIFSVQLDEADTERRANVLRASIEQLTKQKAALNKANKESKISAEEYAAGLEANRKATTVAKQELTGLNRVMDLQVRSNKAAAGSMDQLKANLSLLTMQFNALSIQERTNADVGGKLQAQIRGISDALKGTEEILGNHTRSVGDYAKATRTTNALLTDLTKTAKQSGESLRTLDSTFGVFGGQLESIKGSLASAKSGLEATKLGFTGLKGAIAATGIGLLIIALGALYSWFTKTQQGLDFIERKTAAVTKVFTFLSDKAVSAGKTIFEAFDNPKRALTELGGAIMDNVINRFKALYEIAYAVTHLDFQRLADGVIQLGTGVTGATGKIQALGKEASAAAAAGEQLARTNQAIRKEESALNVERAKSRAEVERLKKIAEDTTKSQKERENAARQAYNVENGLLARQLALQQRKINALKSERAEGKRTQEQQNAINEAQAEYYELQEDSLGKQTELQNSLNSIRQESADKAKAANEAAKAAAKEQLQLAVDIAQKRLDLAKLRGQDTLALETDLIRKQAAVEKSNYQKSAQARQLIEAETLAKIAALNVQAMAERASLVQQTQKAGIEAQLALVQEGSATELKLRLELIKVNADAEKAELRKSANQTVEGQRLLNAQLVKVDAETKGAILKAEREFAEKQVSIKQEAVGRIVALDTLMQQRIAQNRDKTFNEQQNLIDAALAGVAQGSDEEFKLRKQAVENRRNMELSAANLTASQIKKINAQANRELEEIDNARLRKKVESVVKIVDGAQSALTGLINANIDSQMRALDKQQQEALKSTSLTAEQRTAIEADYQKRKIELEREAAKKRKKIATVENLINTAKAVTVALLSGFDPITKAISVALAVATGAAQQAIIEQQQFARGGAVGYVSDSRGAYIRGAGTGKSDSINARISNGESVINAESTKQFYGLLSWINQLGGGRAFPGAGKVRGTAGIVAKAAPGTLSAFAGGGVATAGIDTQALAVLIEEGVGRALEKMPPPQVGVDEISRAQNRVQVRENQNSF